MTSRDRILAAIRFEGPDRAPIHHYCFPGAIWRHGQKLLDLVDKYPDDFGNENIVANVKAYQLGQGETEEDIVEYVDGWGTTWRRMRGYTAGEVHIPALPNWDVWQTYEFPPLPPESHYEEFTAAIPERKAQGEFIRAGGGPFFQHMQHLRGNANYYLDLAEDNTGVHELADRMVEYNLHSIERYVKMDIDCLCFGDDWGEQERLLINPETWRRFMKPRYAKMMAPAREQGIEVWFHSDGYILDIIEDLIEIGVTLLNPQHPCMDTRKVGEIVKGRCCIRTDIDRQWVMPFGTPDDVRAAVKEAMEAFSTDAGGTMLHGEIGQEVPYENIQALYEAFYEYGQYPLSL